MADTLDTSTQMLERISERIADKLTDKMCDKHLKCNKETEIALMQKDLECLPEIKKSIKNMEEFVVKSNTERNIITSIVGIAGGVLGAMWGSK